MRCPKVDGIGDGTIVVAAITSCTNTSNPTVMIGAGLVAKKALVRRAPSPSSAPFSKVTVGVLSGLSELRQSLCAHPASALDTCGGRGTQPRDPSFPPAAAILSITAHGATAWQEHGLTVSEDMKTSLSPGSKVVGDYLARSGLQDSLDQLGFHVTGFGCK